MLAKMKNVNEDCLNRKLAKKDGVSMHAEGYESLAAVLHAAFRQAAFGKGKERHAQPVPFDEQPMLKLIDLYGDGFALGQAGKKMEESRRLPREQARAELLGAINYIAGAVIALDRTEPEEPPDAANDDNDMGWAEWGGGDCPVGFLDAVEVRLRDGNGTHTGRASFFDWSHDGSMEDVVAYRVTRVAKHG